jgi:hypothetical protein
VYLCTLEILPLIIFIKFSLIFYNSMMMWIIWVWNDKTQTIENKEYISFPATTCRIREITIRWVDKKIQC